ncbi:Uncharacterized protein APZ42_021521, partial [Daphnia magna]
NVLCNPQYEEEKKLTSVVVHLRRKATVLCLRLEDALAAWDPHETKIGSLFSKQFWNQFDDYFRFFTHAKELLREKQCRDEEFIEICKLRQGAALHTIDSLLDLPVSPTPPFAFVINGHNSYSCGQCQTTSSLLILGATNKKANTSNE